MPRLLPATAVLAALATAAVWAQKLVVSQANDEVRITAPELHFLTGKPLERIRNGNSVAFDFQLVALNEARSLTFGRAFERFVVSYDLWEQTFSVSRLRSKRGQAAHMTAQQAEAWCVEGVTLSSAPLPKDEPLRFRLEIRAVDGKLRPPVFDDDQALGLSTLIDVFSRAGKAGRDDAAWKLEAGPIQLRRTR